MQTTALVHEAYPRLVKIDNVTWLDRVHFFALSAQLMRRILVDAARAVGGRKLQFFREDRSEKHPRDIRSMIASSGEQIVSALLHDWIRRLDVEVEWRQI